MVNIGSTSTGGRILAVKSDLAKIVLTTPVCTQEGEKIALSRRVEKHWRYAPIWMLALFADNIQIDWMGSNSSWKHYSSVGCLVVRILRVKLPKYANVPFVWKM